MAKKRKAARGQAISRPARKPARRRQRDNPDATVNTLVILVVIVMVLGGLYFYAQNKKQAALFPSLTQAIATFIAPALKALPMAGFNAPESTGSIPSPKPAPSTITPATGSDITLQPTSSLESLHPARVGAAHTVHDD